MLEVNCIASATERIRGRFLSFGIRYINYFEPFAKYGISYYVKGELKKRMQQGVVSAYKVKTRRLSRWHYRIEVYLDLTPRQAVFLMTQLFRRLRGKGEVT